MVEICHFHFAFDSERELLFFNNVSSYLFVEHVGQSLSHVGLKIYFEGGDVVAGLFRYDLCVSFIIKQLKLAAAHLSTLAGELELEFSRGDVWATTKLGVFLAVLGTRLAEEMALSVEVRLLYFLRLHDRISANVIQI